MRIPSTHAPVPPRAIGVSLLALLVAILGNTVLAQPPGPPETLLWLLAVIPAFLLAYYRKWKGVALALAVSMAAIMGTELSLARWGGESLDPRLLVLVVGAVIAISLGLGWLSDALHRARFLAEKSSLELIALLDERGRFRYVGPSAESLLGIAPEELVGTEALRLVERSGRRAIRDRIRSLVGGAEAEWTGEVRVRDARGECRVLDIVAQDRYSDPAVGGLVISARDLTDRRRAEERERILVTAIEQAAEIVVIMDPEGTILYANRAFERDTGHSREGVVGRSLPALLGNGAEGPVREGLRQAVVEKGVWARRLEARRESGSALHLQTTVSAVVDDRGEVQHAVAVGYDVSERLRLDEHLRENQKMEELGSLTGGIAHDFNNLLTVILANTDVLYSELAGAEAAVRSGVNDVREAALRGSELVSRLLLFARKEPMELAPLDVGAFLEGLAPTLPRLLTPRISVQLSTDEALPPIRSNRTALEQILLNLASNARDAMPEGGALKIAARSVTLTDEDRRTHPWIVPGRYVEIRVEDTGTGMDPDTLERIFEPLFTTKEQGHGTGLGLAVVYGLVKEHDGFIHAYSNPGEGTAFNVYLPVTGSEFGGDPDGEEAGGGEPAALPTGSETILVIDDEAALLRAAQRILTGLGYRVLTAPDGSSGVDLFRSRGPEIDLVLSDLVLPGMSGAEVLRAVREHDPDLPVILMSGYSPMEAGRREIPDGIHFLEKPWSVQELAVSIRSVLEGEREAVASV